MKSYQRFLKRIALLDKITYLSQASGTAFGLSGRTQQRLKPPALTLI